MCGCKVHLIQSPYFTTCMVHLTWPSCCTMSFACMQTPIELSSGGTPFSRFGCFSIMRSMSHPAMTSAFLPRVSKVLHCSSKLQGVALILLSYRPQIRIWRPCYDNETTIMANGILALLVYTLFSVVNLHVCHVVVKEDRGPSNPHSMTLFSIICNMCTSLSLLTKIWWIGSLLLC